MLFEDALVRAASRPSVQVAFEPTLVVDMRDGYFETYIVSVATNKRFYRIARSIKPGGHLIITTANKFVIDRWDMGADPDSHIKQWLNMKSFKRLLQPHFRIVKTSSIIPVGDRGILRLINSHRFSALLKPILSEDQIRQVKEKAGLGYSLIALAQKH